MLVAALLSVLLAVEDFRCSEDNGCDARINRDGNLETVSFRKGDLVSTEDGWYIIHDDGWVKVKGNKCQQVLAGYLWLGGNTHFGLGLVPHVPVGIQGAWARPAPPLLCLVGRSVF